MEKHENSGAHVAAQLAAAAANIARGAAQGGAAGAAVEGVKSFAPQLLKIIGGVLFFILCLPLLIFTALPSNMFAFPSVDDPEIAQLTSAAHQAADNYAKTQHSIQQRADHILQTASVGYDDVKASQSLQGFDGYWMAAISSVLHMQDLGEINAQETHNIINYSVQSSSSTEFYYVEEEYVYVKEDGSTEVRTRQVQRRRLHIALRASTPVEVMDQLGFTPEQRLWATQLHDTIADNQEQNEGGLVDLGDVTFTDASVPTVYYAQTDSRWGTNAYSGSTIGVAGCGPTAVAMVASTLGRSVTPAEVAAWSEQTGHACYGNGSYHSLVPDGLAHYGLRVECAGMPSAQRLVDALVSGKLVVVIMGPGTFTNSGHFMVLRGVTVDGKVLIADPISYNRSQRAWDLALIMKEAKRTASAGGPFWIVS